jgi:hypothetical protein
MSLCSVFVTNGKQMMGVAMWDRVGLAFGAGNQFRPVLPVLALQQRPENETDADHPGNLQDVGKLAKDGENS